jgi:hypothetical protein
LIECFSACDLSLVDTAIATLEALDGGAALTAKEYTYWRSELHTRCQFLARLYREDDYMTLCDETLHLLDSYEGRQTDVNFDEYRRHLLEFGWVISPRMWTAHEIVVLCVILVNPCLQFSPILQKDKGKNGEVHQNRAMACLDSRVQAVMFSRLKFYGYADEGHLPQDVPAGVVLNSGGSYLQLVTWQYLHCARFVTDFSVKPSIIIVEGAPEYTGGNAVYVATTTRRPSGQPVYVSISPIEMYGPPPKTEDPAAWDGTPLQRSLSKMHALCSLIEQSTTSKKWATERVLYMESSKIVIQSITAYGTSMRMLELNCDKIGEKVTSAKAIINFNWSEKASVMEHLPSDRLPTVRVVKHVTPTNLSHKLSFGIKKFVKNVGIAKTKNEGVPQGTRKQQFHKDGPTRYDKRQFETNGTIKTNAPIATVRNDPLPTLVQGRATSALFAFFTRTFLGLKPAAKIDRVHPSTGLRLHAPIGTAVIFYFDEDHQGWKCLSKDERRANPDAELAIHVRAHFYVYSKDLRFLPTSDLEETFEFLACYAQGRCLDEGTKLVMLESLNTFVNEPNPVQNAYSTFQGQQQLDNHVSKVAAANPQIKRRKP